MVFIVKLGIQFHSSSNFLINHLNARDLSDHRENVLSCTLLTMFYSVFYI